MKKTILSLLAVCACLTLEAQNAETAGSRRDNLEKHVYFLADDSMAGRAAGSPASAKAREYIAGEFAGLGMRPFFSGWEMPFIAQGQQTFRNVVGIIDGSDPKLKDEYIVLGAHYDHLGVKNGKVYNGADDNASGTAAIIEIARVLAKNRDKLDRSVIIAAFDAEELGLYGSSMLAKVLADTLDIRSIRLMMSVDMVGWYRQNGCLELEGTGTIRDGKELAMGEAMKAGINIKTRRFEISPFTATDTQGFARYGVPTLAVSTGLKSPYHKPEDDPELIDYNGLDQVAGYLTGLTLNVADDPSFAASGKIADKHRPGNKPFEFGIWAGIDRASAFFPDAKFETNSRIGWTGGLSAQVNSGSFGLRLGADYGWLPCSLPDEGNLYGSALKLRMQAVTIPLSIIMETEGGPVRGYLGVGGFYRRILSSEFEAGAPSYSVNPDQWGWQYTIGFKLGRIALDLDRRFQIGRMLDAEPAFKARLFTTSLKLGYIF